MNRGFLFCVLVCSVTPTYSLAGIREDFERGSGGVDTALFTGFLQTSIYTLMCILGAWVVYRALHKLIDSDEDAYFDVFKDIFRVTILCVVVILSIT